jgi:hypothetical protein
MRGRRKEAANKTKLQGPSIKTAHRKDTKMPDAADVRLA